MLCFLSFNINVQSDTHISSEKKSSHLSLQNIFKEEDFLNQFLENDLNTEFRIFVRTSSDLDNFYLKRYSYNIKYYRTYTGIGLTIKKINLLKLIQEKTIIEVWNNSRILGANAFDQLLINSSRTICNYSVDIGAEEIWREGFFGDDTKVAILDTGIDVNHLALNTTMDGADRIIEKWNFLSNNEDVHDDNNHGTEVAGIIGSNGKYGYNLGVAPNCLFLIGKILDNAASGTVESLVQGLDWALENEADVINLSLGKVVSNLTSIESEAVNYVVENGITVCVSSGNIRGTEEFGYNDIYTVLSPGIATKAITVGAIDSNGILYEHSSAGPVALNYNSDTTDYLYDSISSSITWLKPDIVAPGVLLNTTSSNGKDTDIVTGTSYATAVITGLCALVKQRYYEAQPSLIKAALLKTAVPIDLSAISPFSTEILSVVPSYYQGAGKVNSTLVFEYLLDHSDFEFYFSQVPFFNTNYFRNSETSFLVHLFVHDAIEDYDLTISGELEGSLFLSSLPGVLNVGQYDILVTINTEGSSDGSHRGAIVLETETHFEEISVAFNIGPAYGRILIDYRMEGNQIKYSPNGNLYNIISAARKAGLIPIINTHDIYYNSLNSLNFLNYEAIALLNPVDSPSQPFSSLDQEKIIDFILPSESNYGGTLVLLPTRTSDFDIINSILQNLNMTYEYSLDENASLSVGYSPHLLLNYPNVIEELYIPYPVLINNTNEYFDTYSNYFAYCNLEYLQGTRIIAGNTLDMFLESPYVYSQFDNDYSDLTITASYGNNYEFLLNIMKSATVTSLDFDYNLTSSEVYKDREVKVIIHSANTYKPMVNWEFYLTLTYNDYTVFKYTECEQYSNGTCIFSFVAKDYEIVEGTYSLNIHSFTETKTFTINILAKISLGPIIVSLSLIICIIFLILFRNKKRVLN